MSVWLVLPSKRYPSETNTVFKDWIDRGYRILVQRDPEDERFLPLADWVVTRPYRGYAEAVNHLTKLALNDEECDWVVCAGDDTQPDMNHTAQQIAAQCREHFTGTFGVMQCTGDRWGEHRNTHAFTPRAGGIPALQMCSQCGRMEDNAIHSLGALIDRVAGSPWMGREFCQRVNQGRGPLWEGNKNWPGYFHMGCDQELQAVATRLGVFWQRPDLIHLHKHWGRGVGDAKSSAANMPEFLARANSKEEWDAYKKLFREREAAGFPGSEPL